MKWLSVSESAVSPHRAHAHDQWVARMPTAEEAAFLELPAGAPVLYVIHTARAEDGAVRSRRIGLARRSDPGHRRLRDRGRRRAAPSPSEV